MRTLCGDSETSFDTLTNRVQLKFKSQSGSSGLYMGFLLNINASTEACGGTLEGSSGTLKTPGYPHQYPHRTLCTWKIIGPPNRRIKLTFDDFDLERPFNRRNRTSCSYDYVYVTSGSLRGFRTPAFNGSKVRCGSEIPEPVFSTSNEMLISFKSDGSVSHRGFSATWSSDEQALCGGVLNGNSGVLRSPMTWNYTYPNRLYCHWIIPSR